MSRARIVLRKELLDIVSSPLLLLSLSGLPLTMTAAFLFVVWAYAAKVDDPAITAVAQWYVPGLATKGAGKILIEITVRNSVGMFLGMPVFLPVLLASQAIAGEKERRTLEPLLATPATARDIVLGKSLAAVAVAMGITVVTFAAFAVGVDLLTWHVFQGPLLPDGLFAFSVLVLAPLLSFFGTCLTVLISARVSDTRLAQSVAGFAVMPFFGLVTLQFAGFLELGPVAYAVMAVLVLLADVLMLWLSVRLFDRDRLLTRWA